MGHGSTLVLAIFAFLLTSTHCSKLNVPRVLLPLFKSAQTNFTLEVSTQGCYKWTMSRLDVVQLTPLRVKPGSDCSNKAMITTISKEFSRNTAIILIEELTTGETLRCDVIVDVISSLNIVTKTRQVYIEEAPEVFEVRAYDEQGNEFTTLEGIEFNWLISGSPGNKHSYSGNVLRFITFKDSLYEIPPTVQSLDTKGLTGHIVLVEGMKTGVAKVSVQLRQPEYQHVSPTEVKLTILANLLLDPPEAYLMPGDQINFRLLQVRSGKFVELPLSSSQYYLKIENGQVIEETSPWVMKALQEGETKIVLRDQNAPHSIDDVSPLPTVKLVVTLPAHMTLVMSPHNNWAVVLHQHIRVAVQLFNRDNHKIHIGPMVRTEIEIASSYFSIDERTTNGSLISGKPIKLGSTPVHAFLRGIRNLAGTVKPFPITISTQADLMIYPVLEINPHEVIVPWDQQVTPNMMIRLSGTGGDGSYKWSSEDPEVASVSQNGLVKPHRLGSTRITMMMQSNQANYATANVVTLLPAYLDVLESQVEGQVGSPININVAFFAERLINGKVHKAKFTDCRDFPFSVTFDNSETYFNSSTMEPLGSACVSFALTRKVVGSTRVTVSYNARDINLKDTVLLTVYDALSVLHPASGETVLAVGSQRDVVFTGGPLSWIGGNSNYEMGTSYDSDVIQFTESPSGDSKLSIFSVTCKSLGVSSAEIFVVDSKKGKRVAESELKVICAKPHSVKLSLEAGNIASDLCPYAIDSDKAVASIARNIKVKVTVKDENGKIFDNATSFNVKWTISDSMYGDVAYPGIVSLNKESHDFYIIPRDHFQLILPKNGEGTARLTAKIIGYRKFWLTELGLDTEKLHLGFIKKFVGSTPEIEDTLTIAFRKDVHVEASNYRVHLFSGNKGTFQVMAGSGHFNVTHDGADYFSIHGTNRAGIYEIIPLKVGHGVVKVRDLCIKSRPATFEITITMLDRIDFTLEKYKLEKNEKVRGKIVILDSFGDAVSLTREDSLKINPVLDANIGNVVMKKFDKMVSRGQINFEFAALDYGTTEIHFAGNFNKQQINSKRQSIQVYSPLVLIPSVLTIIRGVNIQVSTQGGPQGCSIEYSLEGNVAEVDHLGLVRGLKVGEGILTARAFDKHSVTGDIIIYSSVSIPVKVLNLGGIKIITPITTIQAGSEMPIWIEGVPKGLSPLVLGSARPAIIFKWSTSALDVVRLKNVFQDSGLQVYDVDEISMRLEALNSGKTTISVDALMPSEISSHDYATFSDSITINVIPPLALLAPPSSYPDMRILMSQNALLKLQIKEEAFGIIDYKIRSLSSTPIVTVDCDGKLQSSTMVGEDILLISRSAGNGFNQTLTIPVEVRPVHYMMLKTETSLHISPEATVSMLPQGMKMPFRISYYDNLGRRFTAVKANTNSVLGRSDEVQVVAGDRQDVVIVNLMKSVDTVLRIWDQDMSSAPEDYVKITSGPLIHPDEERLTVGDVICFSMPLVTDADFQCAWVSRDKDALSIDENTGVAIAKKSQNGVVVSYHCSNMISTSTTVDIHPLNHLEFISRDRNVTNNGNNIPIPILLSSSRQSKQLKANNLVGEEHCPSTDISPHFPFSCEIRFDPMISAADIASVMWVKPHFDLSTGLYSCLVGTVEPVLPRFSILRTTVLLKLKWGHELIDQLSLPFLPAIHVRETSVSLSEQKPIDFITIVGLDYILEEVTVTPPSGCGFRVNVELTSNPETTKYIVILDDWNAFKTDLTSCLVTIHSTLTKQTLEIPVTISAGENNRQCSASNLEMLRQKSYDMSSRYGQYIWALVLAVVVAIITHNVVNYFRRDDRIFLNNTYQPVHPVSPNVSGTLRMTPNSNSSTSHRRIQRGNDTFSNLRMQFGSSPQ